MIPAVVEAWTTPSSPDNSRPTASVSRRSIVIGTLVFGGAAAPLVAGAEEANMFAPKFVQEYEDFQRTPEGWSFRDVTPGKSSSSGVTASPGDRVVFDWSGYTIGK